MGTLEWVAVVLFVALAAYAVFAGADFGGGVLDLVARGPRREAQREAIAGAIGAVWEANHVWLIFVIVLLFSCFPAGSAVLSQALFVPFHLLLLGVILRGVSFVFRSYGPHRTVLLRRWGRLFGIASVASPVLLGVCLGAVSSGRVRVIDGAVLGAAAAVLSPLSVALGLFALAVCAYLAAVFLTVETEGTLADDFRRYALEIGGAVVALSGVVLALVGREAPHLWRGLTEGPGRAVVSLGVAAALASGGLLLTRRYRAARAATVVQVVSLLGGWAAAQWPFLVYPDVRADQTAAPQATLVAVLTTLIPAALLVVPSLALLFWVFKARPDRAR